MRALSARGVNLLRSAATYARVLATGTRLKAHGDSDLIFQDARGCPTVQVHIYIRVFSYSTYDHEVGVRKLRSPRGCVLSLAGAIPLKSNEKNRVCMFSLDRRVRHDQSRPLRKYTCSSKRP